MSIAILVYHRLTDGKPQDFHDVARADFLAQLDGLVRQGLRGEGLLPRLPDGRGVLFSFDDGTEDHLWAAEQLASRGWRGLFLISPALIGQPGRLREADVRTMAQAGHQIGAHGFSHARLDRLETDILEADLIKAREHLAGLCGAPPQWFAPPGGIVPPGLLPRLQQAGFVHCRSMRWGMADESLQGLVPVLPITARTGPDGVSRLLAYPDWLLRAAHGAKQMLRGMVGAGMAEKLRDAWRPAREPAPALLQDGPANAAALFFHILRFMAVRNLPMAAIDGRDAYPRLAGHDGDVLVAAYSWDFWLRLIGKALQGSGWCRLSATRRGHVMILFIGRADGDGSMLQLDLHRAGSSNGLAFASSMPMLERAERQHDVLWLVPADAVRFRAGERHQPRLRDWREAMLRRPWLVLQVLAWKLLDGVHSYLSPSGQCWSLSGPDGAGKSALLAALRPLIERELCLFLHQFHTRPFLLGGGGTDGQSRPASRRPGKIVSIARLLLAAADYSLGYWLRVRPILARGGIVVFDRHVPDYRADGRVRGIDLPDILMRVLDFAAPSPHGRVMLLAAPEILAARKGELSNAEAVALAARYRALGKEYGALLLESDVIAPDALARQMAAAIRRAYQAGSACM